MLLNDLKSEFSQAYVRAVAHAAGYFVCEANRPFDGDGIDLMLMSRTPAGTVRSPRLDLQLKATANPIEEDPFPYDLDVKNYNELRSDTLQVPRILVVVSVPRDTASWVKATKDELILRYCGYWKTLRGEGVTDNKKTIRVFIDRKDCFHVANLQDIMNRISVGGLP